jgi:hypothetical protein
MLKLQRFSLFVGIVPRERAGDVKVLEKTAIWATGPF